MKAVVLKKSVLAVAAVVALVAVTGLVAGYVDGADRAKSGQSCSGCPSKVAAAAVPSGDCPMAKVCEGDSVDEEAVMALAAQVTEEGEGSSCAKKATCDVKKACSVLAAGEKAEGCPSQAGCSASQAQMVLAAQVASEGKAADCPDKAACDGCPLAGGECPTEKAGACPFTAKAESACGSGACDQAK